MSSLPQGWHGIPVATKNGGVSTAHPTMTPIRKKWNSPLSTEVPKSKLPSYKSSNLRLQKSAVNGMIPTKSASKSQSSISKNDASSPVKISPAKQYQSEIAKLKKELATVKTENSILKVKVRRVDDENDQKAKQIEKLRVELKSVQKVDSSSSRKSKESELLLLRQKCLRLEGALREKDLALHTFRKLNNESSLRNGVPRRNNTCQIEASNASDTNPEISVENSKSVGKSASKSQSSLPRSSQLSKTEVAKFREMIHKLEKENADLQLQLKSKNEEIRGLKAHLRSQANVAKTPSLATSAKEGTAKIEVVPKTPPTKPTAVPKPEVRKPAKTASSKSTSLPPTKGAPAEGSAVPRAVPRKPRTPADKKGAAPDSKSAPPEVAARKTKRVVPPAPPSAKAAQASLKPPEVPLSAEERAHRLRQNIAARTIQRGWRTHQKRVGHHYKDDKKTKEKVLTFIVTSLKHHKLRKAKMNMLRRRKGSSTPSTPRVDHVTPDAIHAAVRSIWKKGAST